jgi:hypothetical protein
LNWTATQTAGGEKNNTKTLLKIMAHHMASYDGRGHHMMAKTHHMMAKTHHMMGGAII